MFYSVGIFRTLSLGDSISSDPKRTALRRREEEPGYTKVLQQRAGRFFCKLKKTRYPKLRSFALLCVCEKVKVFVAQSCPTVCNPMDCVTCQAPLFMEFSRQEYWSG